MLRFALRVGLFIAVTGCVSGALLHASSPQRVVQPNSAALATISGQLIVTAPGLWDNIEVILEFETGIPVAYMHTGGNNGNFAFPVNQPGRYFVVVDLNGFEKVRERVDVIQDQMMLPLRIFLVPNGAKEAAAEVRRKYSKKAVDEFEKAQDELKKGDLAKAVQRLTAAMKEAPTFFDAQLLLGTVYYKQRQMPEAELAYKKARELDSKAPLPLVNLGQLYIETADAGAGRDTAAAAKVYQAAYDALAEAVKLDAKSSNAVLLLGVSSYKLNRNDEAETHLKTALQLDKRMGQAQVMLANVYIRKQSWANALEILDAYLKDHANAPDAKAIQETRTKVAERVSAAPK